MLTAPYCDIKELQDEIKKRDELLEECKKVFLEIQADRGIYLCNSNLEELIKEIKDMQSCLRY